MVHADSHTPGDPLILPAKLRSLELQLGSEYTDAVINALLTALSGLPLLSHLRLALCAFNDVNGVDLRILSACPSLENLFGCCPCFSHAQMDQLRLSFGHLHRFSLGFMHSYNLAVLLWPPVAVRWRDIGRQFADEHTGELLLRLPMLTKADLRLIEGIPHVDFLSQLPHLSSLYLDRDNTDEWYIPADPLLASHVRCFDV